MNTQLVFETQKSEQKYADKPHWWKSLKVNFRLVDVAGSLNITLEKRVM